MHGCGTRAAAACMAAAREPERPADGPAAARWAQGRQNSAPHVALAQAPRTAETRSHALRLRGMRTRQHCNTHHRTRLPPHVPLVMLLVWCWARSAGVGRMSSGDARGREGGGLGQGRTAGATGERTRLHCSTYPKNATALAWQRRVMAALPLLLPQVAPAGQGRRSGGGRRRGRATGLGVRGADDAAHMCAQLPQESARKCFAFDVSLALDERSPRGQASCQLRRTRARAAARTVCLSARCRRCRMSRCTIRLSMFQFLIVPDRP